MNIITIMKTVGEPEHDEDVYRDVAADEWLDHSSGNSVHTAFCVRNNMLHVEVISDERTAWEVTTTKTCTIWRDGDCVIVGAMAPCKIVTPSGVVTHDGF